MKSFKIFTVGLLAAALAACTPPGGGGTPGGQVGKITISPTKVEVGASQSKSLTATVKDSAGKTLTDVQVKWEVMDSGVAKVASQGKLAATLTGVEAGETEVFAAVGDVQSAPVSVVVSGNDPGPGPTPGKGLSGTLYAPTGGDVKDTLVIACVVVGQSCDLQDPRTKGTKVGNAGTSYNYSLDVEAGDYVLLSWNDVNKSGQVDSGDYSICYGGKGLNNCAVVRAPKQGLDLRMEVVGGGDPGPGPGESSISGTVFAAKGSTLNGVKLLACETTSKKCAGNAYTQAVAQAPYTLKVASGKYFVFGWHDANQSTEIDAGDQFGCYGQNAKGECAVFDVNAAVSGKDVRLAVVAGGGGIQSLSMNMFKTLKLNTSVNKEQLENFLKQ